MDGLKREPTSGPFGGQVHTTDEAPPPEGMVPVEHPPKPSSADEHDVEKEDNDEHHMDEGDDPWTAKTTDQFAFPGMDTEVRFPRACLASERIRDANRTQTVKATKMENLTIE